LLQTTLKEKSGQSSVPNVFVNGKHLGGCDDTFNAHHQNKLLPMIQGMEGDSGEDNYDYDLIVIGGGSGGLAASKVSYSL